MKTRRFKALNGLKGKYSEIVEKIAIYDNNGNQIDCCIIQKDADGREYYCPSNPNDEFGLFVDKPKDAIEFIRNGFGDTIQRMIYLGVKIECVARFLDREYGEKLRKETIDGWKTAKFVYGIKLSYNDPLNSGRYILKDATLMGFGDRVEDILTFDTESEATAFIEDVNSKAKAYNKEYMSLLDKRTPDKEPYHEMVIIPFFNKIKGMTEYDSNSIYWRTFIGMTDGVPNYSMEVVQVVLP